MADYYWATADEALLTAHFDEAVTKLTNALGRFSFCDICIPICMYRYMYIYIYTYIHIYMCVCLRVCVFVCVCLCVCMNAGICE